MVYDLPPRLLRRAWASPRIRLVRPAPRSRTGLGNALTCTAFNWKLKAAVLRTAPRHVSAPAPAPGLTWTFAWQVLDSNLGRLSPAVLHP